MKKFILVLILFPMLSLTAFLSLNCYPVSLIDYGIGVEQRASITRPYLFYEAQNVEIDGTFTYGVKMRDFLGFYILYSKPLTWDIRMDIGLDFIDGSGKIVFCKSIVN